jgi:hypothetical protein
MLMMPHIRVELSSNALAGAEPLAVEAEPLAVKTLHRALVPQRLARLLRLPEEH